MNIYIYAFSRCFYPKQRTVHSDYTCFVCVFSGIEPTTFCAANTMLYHWATGSLSVSLNEYSLIIMLNARWLACQHTWSGRRGIYTYLCSACHSTEERGGGQQSSLAFKQHGLMKTSIEIMFNNHNIFNLITQKKKKVRPANFNITEL